MSFVSDTRNSNNDFFSTVSSSASKGFETVFSQILPVWAAKELGVQNSDQLQNSTYNQNTAPPTQQNYQGTTEGAGAQKAGLFFDSINISGAGILGVAIAAVVGVAIARM